MCWLSDLFKKQEMKPDWITQSREEVAEAERDAAATHYAWLIALEEGRMTVQEITIGGGIEHHTYWYQKHIEAAWYTENPIKRRLRWLTES